MKIYLVGGAVRDTLLGLASKDLDYCVVGAAPEDMLALGYTQVGADFPVFLHPETKDEYALARIERKNGQGYGGFDFNVSSDVTLEDDLSRRDLTINSMAMDDDGTIVDPFHGQKDLELKILRHTTDSFKEDPLRILRICRFAARYPEFSIAPETIDFMSEMVAGGELHHLTKERVWAELAKTFTELHPSRFFDYLNEVKGLEVLFPEIYEMIGVPQRQDYHAEGDVYVHTMMVMDEAAKLVQSKKLNSEEQVEIVAAALWHDVGKAKTPHELLYHEDGSMKGHHHGHDDTDIVEPILKDVKDRLKMPNVVFKIVTDVALMHQKAHGLNAMSAKGVVRMFNKFNFKQKGGVEYLNKVLTACHADSLGRRLLVNDKLTMPPTDYPQKDEMIELFKSYNEVTMKSFVSEYRDKNDISPPKDIIIQENHRLRLNAIKKVLKKKAPKKLKP